MTRDIDMNWLGKLAKIRLTEQEAKEHLADMSAVLDIIDEMPDINQTPERQAVGLSDLRCDEVTNAEGDGTGSSIPKIL